MAKKETVVVAGGSGFIGRAVAHRLALKPNLEVRVLTRDPARARARIGRDPVQLLKLDLLGPTRGQELPEALAGARAVFTSVQFDGYPVEDPGRKRTFEQVDLGATVALLEAARRAGAPRFIYVSGVGADARARHPAFRAKGLAEDAIRRSGLEFTIFRPSLVYGPGDRVVSMAAAALRFAPVLVVPGNGRQKLQPIFVEDLATCAELAVEGRGRNGVFEAGGPRCVTLEEFLKVIMQISRRHRPIVRLPAAFLQIAGRLAELLPRPPFSADAAMFLLADSQCQPEALQREFGLSLTPLEEGLSYLASR